MADEAIKEFLFSPNITARYIGEVKDGLPNGWGKAHLSNGLIYEGEWKDGKLDGMAKQFYPGGTIEYEGEFQKGVRNGYGKSYLREGRIKYEGNWIKGEQANGPSTKNNWA